MRTVGSPAVIKILDSSTLTNKKIPPFHFQTSAKSDVQFNTQKKFLSIQVSHRVVEIIARNSLKILELFEKKFGKKRKQKAGKS